MASPSRSQFAKYLEEIENVHIKNIMSFLIRQPSFTEMVDAKCPNIDLKQSYREFFDWNLKCITNLTPGTYSWIHGLCKMMEGRAISEMDIDGCKVYPITAFYFNKECKLILVHFS